MILYIKPAFSDLSLTGFTPRFSSFFSSLFSSLSLPVPSLPVPSLPVPSSPASSFLFSAFRITVSAERASKNAPIPSCCKAEPKKSGISCLFSIDSTTVESLRLPVSRYSSVLSRSERAIDSRKSHCAGFFSGKSF